MASSAAVGSMGLTPNLPGVLQLLMRSSTLTAPYVAHQESECRPDAVRRADEDAVEETAEERRTRVR